MKILLQTIEARKSNRIAKKRDPSLQIPDHVELPVRTRTRRVKKYSDTKTEKMAHYTFDQNVLEATFKGSEFYQMRCNDLFLTDLSTVENILCQGKKIRQQLKTLQAGQTLTYRFSTIKEWDTSGY
ncbi:hypothetical protein ACJJTC_014069 [Scirpophaga incertulas]